MARLQGSRNCMRMATVNILLKIEMVGRSITLSFSIPGVLSTGSDRGFSKKVLKLNLKLDF